MKEKFWLAQGYMVQYKPRYWKSKARWLVEEKIGRELNPTKEKVKYIDGDYKNCTLENILVQDFQNRIEWSVNPNGDIITRNNNIWCRKYAHCRICKTDKHPHKALGLCGQCYYKDYWK